MNVRITIAFVATAVFCAGCASDRVVQPAKVIATEVLGLQADLARYQTQLGNLQSAEVESASANDIIAGLATGESQLKLTAWTVTQASTTMEAFSALQKEADAEIAVFVSGPNVWSRPAVPTLPLDKLTAVSTIVSEMAKDPGTKADAQSLVDFAQQVNSDLGDKKK